MDEQVKGFNRFLLGLKSFISGYYELCSVLSGWLTSISIVLVSVTLFLPAINTYAPWLVGACQVAINVSLDAAYFGCKALVARAKEDKDIIRAGTLETASWFFFILMIVTLAFSYLKVEGTILLILVIVRWGAAILFAGVTHGMSEKKPVENVDSKAAASVKKLEGENLQLATTVKNLEGEIFILKSKIDAASETVVVNNFVESEILDVDEIESSKKPILFLLPGKEGVKSERVKSNAVKNEPGVKSAFVLQRIDTMKPGEIIEEASKIGLEISPATISKVKKSRERETSPLRAVKVTQE